MNIDDVCHPAQSNLYSWQSIWSAFITAPRVRAWLFSNKPPPTHHIYQSLQTHPTLLGFEFTSLDRSHLAKALLSDNHPYPDIGDLATVFTTDGHTLLGFNYGFRAVQPFIPPLHSITRDHSMSDPKTLVRRTARRLVHSATGNYFLSMEFSWFESGALAVSTCVNPVQSKPSSKGFMQSNKPFYDHFELRFFSAPAAARLVHLSKACDLLPTGHPLPHSLVLPHEEYYVVRIRQPPFPFPGDDGHVSNSEPQTTLPIPTNSHFTMSSDLATSPAVSPAAFTSQTAEQPIDFTSIPHPIPSLPLRDPKSHVTTPSSPVVERDISSAVNNALSSYSGRVVHGDDNACMAHLWRLYREVVAEARQTGVFMSLISRTVYTPTRNEHDIIGRYGQYEFMSTPFSVQGRVQLLCEQLGLSCSTPGADNAHLRGRIVGSRACRVDANACAGDRRRICASDDVHHVPHHHHALNAGQRERDSIADVAAAHAEEDVRASAQPCAASAAPGCDSSSGSLSWITADTYEKMRAPAPAQGRCGEVDARGDYAITPASGTGACGSTVADVDADADELLFPVVALPAAATTAAIARRSMQICDVIENADMSVHESSSSSMFSALCAGKKRAAEDTDGRDMADAKASAAKRCKSEETVLSGDGGDGNGWRPTVGAVAAAAAAVAAAAAAEDEDDEGEGEGETGCEVGSRKRKASGDAEGSESKWSNMVWTCERCGAKIRGKRGNLNRHIASKHDNVRAFVCETFGCGRRFQTRLNLVRHVTAVHDGRPFGCQECPRAFKSLADREAHMRSAHLQCGGRLSCSICGGCFGRRSTLNRHMANVHKVRYVS